MIRITKKMHTTMMMNISKIILAAKFGHFEHLKDAMLLENPSSQSEQSTPW